MANMRMGGGNLESFSHGNILVDEEEQQQQMSLHKNNNEAVNKSKKMSSGMAALGEAGLAP